MNENNINNNFDNNNINFIQPENIENINPNSLKKKNLSIVESFLDKCENYFLEYNEENINLINNKKISKEKNNKELRNKKKSIIDDLIRLKKRKEFNAFMKKYKKKLKYTQNLKYQLKTVFNIRSDFIIIWKFIFSLFNVFIIYLIFFKYFILELSIKPKNYIEKNINIKLTYILIQLMFTIELIISIFILIYNKCSYSSYIKLILKIYNIIPFTLSRKYFNYMIPKFFRFDLIQKLFNIIELYLKISIINNIPNYYIKIFLTYLNQLFKFLLIFGLYAHCTGCLFTYFNRIKTEKIIKNNYTSSLYYTIETFTTIGFGSFDLKKSGNESKIIVCINLFIGVNMFSMITSNLRYLIFRLIKFKREISIKKKFEFLILKSENNTQRVFPLNLEKLINANLLINRKISLKYIKNEYEKIFSLFKPEIKKDLFNNLLNYLKEEYHIFFENNETLMYKILANLKPKIFKKSQSIISYGETINKMYFLLKGKIYLLDKNGKTIFMYNKSTIFGDFEFISGFVSDFEYKVENNKSAIGFELSKEDWNSILKEEILSCKKFFKFSLNKKIKIYELKKLYSKKNNINIKNDNKKDNKNKIINKKRTIKNEINLLRFHINKLETDLIELKKNIFNVIEN